MLVSLINTSASTTVSCPSGWSQAYDTVNGFSTQLAACTYVVGSSTPIAKATLSSATQVAMVTEAFSGINPTHPIDVAHAVSGIFPPSVTTTEPGDLLVLGEGSNTPSFLVFSAPSGASLLTTLTNSSYSQTAIATEVVTSPGATSSAGWSAWPSPFGAVTGVVALVSATAPAGSAPGPADPPQAITFTSSPPANPTVGGSYTVSATGGGSGNPVTFSIGSGSTSGACSISGATVSFTGPGTCAIDANQAAGGSYSAAPQVQQSLTIAALADPPQAITFTSSPPANPTVGGSYTVSATGGGSGNPVTFSIGSGSTSGACSISGATVSFTGPGTCAIDANQAAGGSYSAAPQVQQSLTIVAATPTSPPSSSESGGGTPSVVGKATTFTSSKSTTPQTSIPTGVASGDVLVSLINTSASTTVSCPSGWSQAYDTVNGFSTQLAACTYVVGSSTPIAKATLSSATQVAMVTEAFSGINPTHPIDVAHAVSGIFPPSVTTTEPGDLLVLGEGSNTPSFLVFSAPSGASLSTTLTNSSYSQTAIATEVVTSPGATSSAGWSAWPSPFGAVTGVVALVSATAPAGSAPGPADPPQAITFTSSPPANPTVGGSYTVERDRRGLG